MRVREVAPHDETGGRMTTGTKTITVLFDDVDAALDRWMDKGWQPISATTYEEPDPSNQRRTLVFTTIVLARMGKPK